MKCQSYESFFDLFSNGTRLKIIKSLQGKELCVSEICDVTGEEQSKISHNLKILTHCHIVDVSQDGKRRIYRLNSKTIDPLLKIVDAHVKRHCDGSCGVRK